MPIIKGFFFKKIYQLKILQKKTRMPLDVEEKNQYMQFPQNNIKLSRGNILTNSISVAKLLD